MSQGSQVASPSNAPVISGLFLKHLFLPNTLKQDWRPNQGSEISWQKNPEVLFAWSPSWSPQMGKLIGAPWDRKGNKAEAEGGNGKEAPAFA